MLLCHIADAGDRSDVTVHAVDAFERDDLGTGGINAAHQFIEMGHVVVPKDEPFCSGPPYPLDHGVMVLRIREDRTVRQNAAKSSQCGQIAHPARCEDQSRFLAVQVRKLGFKGDMLPVGARDVPRAPGARTRQVDGLVHGGQNIRVLAHSEIIVAAPDCQPCRGRVVMSVSRYRLTGREFAGDAPDLSGLLAAAHEKKVRPRCLCTAAEPEMYVARFGDDLLLKRMPGTGHLHDPSCPTFDPPPELSGLGQVNGKAIVSDHEGATALKLDFPLSMRSGRAVTLADGTAAAATSATATPSKLSLLGMLHYLWDTAESPVASVLLTDTTPPTALYVPPHHLAPEAEADLREIATEGAYPAWIWAAGEFEMPELPMIDRG